MNFAVISNHSEELSTQTILTRFQVVDAFGKARLLVVAAKEMVGMKVVIVATEKQFSSIGVELTGIHRKLLVLDAVNFFVVFTI